jgi:hypothetical protein
MFFGDQRRLLHSTVHVRLQTAHTEPKYAKPLGGRQEFGYVTGKQWSFYREAYTSLFGQLLLQLSAECLRGSDNLLLQWFGYGQGLVYLGVSRRNDRTLL